MKNKILLVICSFLFVPSLYAATLPTRGSGCAKFEAAVAKGTASQKLNKFLDVQWNYLMVTIPELATYTGHPGQNDRWR